MKQWILDKFTQCLCYSHSAQDCNLEVQTAYIETCSVVLFSTAPGGHSDVKVYTCMNITSKTDPGKLTPKDVLSFHEKKKKKPHP